MEIGWKKLWDQAMDHGMYTHCQEHKEHGQLRVLAHAKTKCPLCITQTNLPTFAGTLIKAKV